MARSAMVLLVAEMILGAGCARQDAYYPIQVGRSATYTLRTPFTEHTDTLNQRRNISVAGAKGVEVASSFGVSRLAWKSGDLLASQMAGAKLEPAATVLAPQKLAKTLNWSGQISFAGGREEATAILTQAKATVTFGGHTFETIHSKLVLDTPKRQIELESDFSPEAGLVRQQQRTNGRFDLEMDLLSER